MLRFIILLYFCCLILCDAVCDESTLLRELTEDLRDNKRLDCLRVALPAPLYQEETIESKSRRLDAIWSSDCSFEANYDWATKLRDTYGLQYGIVYFKDWSTPWATL